MDSRARYSPKNLEAGILERARTCELCARYEEAEALLLSLLGGQRARHAGQVPLWVLLSRVRRRLAAYPEARKALSIAASLLPPPPVKHPDAHEIDYERAELESDCGDFDSAETLHRTILAQRLRARGPSHPDVLQSRVAVAELCRLRGNPAEAWQLCREAELACSETLDPQHLLLSKVLIIRSRLMQADGLLSEAESSAARALALREETLGTGHPDFAVAAVQLADVHREAGRHDEAHRLATQAVAILEACLGPNHPDVAAALHQLGVVERAAGKLVNAEGRHLRAIAIMRHAFGANHPRLAGILYHLGLLYRDASRLQEAEAVLRLGLQTAKLTRGDTTERPLCAGALAEVLARRGHLSEAAALYTEAISLGEKRLGPRHPFVAVMLGNLALLKHIAGDLPAADDLYRRAAAASEHAPLEGCLETIVANHARLLRQTQSPAQGEHGQDRPMV